jgi:hypothetical protein
MSNPSRQFDEGYYRRRNPDVRKALDAGEFPSGFYHFEKFGRFEGRVHRYIALTETVEALKKDFSGIAVGFESPPNGDTVTLEIFRLDHGGASPILKSERTVKFKPRDLDASNEIVLSWPSINNSADDLFLLNVRVDGEMIRFCVLRNDSSPAYTPSKPAERLMASLFRKRSSGAAGKTSPQAVPASTSGA